MIEIKRNHGEVELWFDCFIPHYELRRFPFTFNCGNSEYAGLLTGKMKTALFEEMQRIRREAYEQGWSDAKAKRAKNDIFKGVL